MRRRDFIALLGGAAIAWPIAVRAQVKMRRVGVLMNAAATESAPQSYLSAFKDALRGLGWIEGQSIRIDVRWNAGNADLARMYAGQLIGLMPDVILVGSTTNLIAAQQATNTVPIVFVQTTDPVVQGFVPNLTRPGGNLTGFFGTEFSIAGKWLDLLKQVSPGLARVGVMFNPETAPQAKHFLPAIESAAPTFGLRVVAKPIRGAAQIEAAAEDIAREPNSGIVLLTDTYVRLNQKLIAELALRHRLPSISPVFGFPKDGGLLSYAPNANQEVQYRQAAAYVDRILRGTKPGDLPVQGSTKLALAINLKTAKTLGLEIPPKLLFTADEVIE
jgi:putative tryptophan/tyrosine transport system substrate-binding protein